MELFSFCKMLFIEVSHLRSLLIFSLINLLWDTYDLVIFQDVHANDISTEYVKIFDFYQHI